MKLFLVAVLVSAASAARLDHLERGYLPPDQNSYSANAGGSSFPSAGAHGNFGLSSQGSQYSSPGRGSNGFGSFGHSNGFGSNGAGSNGFGANGGHGSNGFGANSGHGSNGFGANSGRGSNGFGSSNYGANGSGRTSGSSSATSNQYLPPNYGSSGSNGGSTFGSSIRSACTTCGSPTFGSPQRYQQQTNTFGSQGHSIPSTQYGTPQSSIPSSNFGSQSSFASQQDVSPGANRQYLAPKSSSFQNTPQQPFDENTGYIY